ncbi:GNAT family N-acetyltransferase [Alteromonas mediterranea]|uniref:GNAT family N-acetyltransferase n=1 Tax=Alteromonas mediterranea TaxID=314275 RepID=UPI0012F79FB5|nr:GNAT family N-acetyltransferase [Alteromonas mediterranea]QGX61090.1 GNAT family N-acetyltransferase [Alteromonas mediterranea]
MTATDYQIKIINSVALLSQARWDKLAQDAGPFLSYHFLLALEQSECCNNESGWQPCHIAITGAGEDTVHAIIPGYLKTHSYGEYVFDHAWADAYVQHGLDYYPKWISAIPFTPVTGPRILSDGKIEFGTAFFNALENKLVDYVTSVYGETLSSLHWLFTDEITSKLLTQEENCSPHGHSSDKTEDAINETLGDASALAPYYLTRYAVQFQWYNYQYKNFDDFLAALTSRKRKDIKKSRRKLHERGIRFSHQKGQAITPDTLQFFTKCYKATYLKRSGHVGYLNDVFFQQLVENLSDNMLIVTAIENDVPVASALFFFDDTGLYGRYWGALKEIDGLHFACCYFEGIEFAIAHQLALFNPGTQGEHKILRGFEPTYCRSHHTLRHTAFHRAVADFLHRETPHIGSYFNQARNALPFNKEFVPTLKTTSVTAPNDDTYNHKEKNDEI